MGMQTVVAILFWYTCASCILATDETLAAGIVMVYAETDEVAVRSFKAPRNQESKPNVASIEKPLLNRGLVLLAIDTDDGYPPCKDAWTLNSYVTTPIRLCVGCKPGAIPFPCWLECVLVVDFLHTCAHPPQVHEWA